MQRKWFSRSTGGFMFRRTASFVGLLSLFAVFVAHGAEPPDTVTLKESQVTWSTYKHSLNAENAIVGGSYDKKTIVDRTFRTWVLENRYLRVTLLPEYGGRILSMIYKPTGHEQLYRTDVGVPYRSGPGCSITTG
jgi:hypothetical protein